VRRQIEAISRIARLAAPDMVGRGVRSWLAVGKARLAIDLRLGAGEGREHLRIGADIDRAGLTAGILDDLDAPQGRRGDGRVRGLAALRLAATTEDQQQAGRQDQLRRVHLEPRAFGLQM
jgi:hypothetical protein